MEIDLFAAVLKISVLFLWTMLSLNVQLPWKCFFLFAEVLKISVLRYWGWK